MPYRLAVSDAMSAVASVELLSARTTSTEPPYGAAATRWSVAAMAGSSFHAATTTVSGGHCPGGHGPTGGPGTGTR